MPSHAKTRAHGLNKRNASVSTGEVFTGATRQAATSRRRETRGTQSRAAEIFVQPETLVTVIPETSVTFRGV